jgi:uncharacterized protein YfaP (DUF2135 family)
MALYEVGLMGDWDARFGDVKEIVKLEYVRFLRALLRGDPKTSVPDYARTRLASLTEEVTARADLVVMITWNTDGTDVDLHVTEPSGEECFYQHRTTRSGGALTKDVTQGYGPEMYVAKSAPHGTFRVRAHYFASNRNRASARTKVYATVIENWGTPEERATEKVVTLIEGKEFHDVMTVTR